MKQYPYISTTMNNFLFYAKDIAGLIGDESNCFSHGFKITVDESKFENNTREFLPNTWGIVESKEHAEFIIELTELHGLDIYHDDVEIERSFFTFNDNGKLFFYDNPTDGSPSNRRQITIPLPPKAKPDFSDLPKHFDCRCNKCGGKCCTGFCGDKFLSKAIEDAKIKLIDIVKAEIKEWPQVSDEALMPSGKCTVKALADKHGNLAVTNEFGFNLIVNKSEIKKPKSKQDLLIEGLQTKLCERNHVDNYMLANDIVNGMIEGLSYDS